MKKFASEFKEFVMRGNVMDMAVGVIIGGAFTGIVTALTTNIINPLIKAITGGKSVNKLEHAAAKLTKKGEEAAEEPAIPVCPHCLEEVKEGATRCPHCAGEIEGGAKA